MESLYSGCGGLISGCCTKEEEEDECEEDYEKEEDTEEDVEEENEEDKYGEKEEQGKEEEEDKGDEEQYMVSLPAVKSWKALMTTSPTNAPPVTTMKQ